MTSLAKVQLRQDTENLLASAPCSVELPAGTGKTHLLCAAVYLACQNQHRSLILTHTNAGVDAIRKRLLRFGVPRSSFRVETLTSWAFTLVRSYPIIAGVSVSEAPDWEKSDEYLLGAAKVARAQAIKSVLQNSFRYLFVDEYQDCTVKLHEFVLSLTESLPQTMIFGDPLQSIFGFTGDLTDWRRDVLPNFPAAQVHIEAHRWKEHNSALGKWTIDIRSELAPGRTFNLATINVPGVEWKKTSGYNSITHAVGARRPTSESTLILVDKPHDEGRIAQKFGGSFQVLEDVRGRVMLKHLDKLPEPNDFRIAAWLAQFAKDCATGLGGIDKAIIAKLDNDLPISHLKREGLSGVLKVLDELRKAPSYELLVQSARILERSPGMRLYRREAWRDTISAIDRCTDDTEFSPSQNLARVRDRLRHSGRTLSSKTVSRTLLVKGLEFDHVIIENLQNMADHHHLYVAITRARKTVTVLGSSPQVTLK